MSYFTCQICGKGDTEKEAVRVYPNEVTAHPSCLEEYEKTH